MRKENIKKLWDEREKQREIKEIKNKKDTYKEKQIKTGPRKSTKKKEKNKREESKDKDRDRKNENEKRNELQG